MFLIRCSHDKALRLGQDGLSIAYHDREWVRRLTTIACSFEFLILEGAQAGLSWELSCASVKLSSGIRQFRSGEGREIQRERVERLLQKKELFVIV